MSVVRAAPVALFATAALCACTGDYDAFASGTATTSTFAATSSGAAGAEPAGDTGSDVTAAGGAGSATGTAQAGAGGTGGTGGAGGGGSTGTGGTGGNAEPLDCAQAFPSNAVCTASAVSCVVFVTLGGATCDAYCQSHGAACLAAWADANDSCDGPSPAACTDSQSDGLCECSAP